MTSDKQIAQARAMANQIAQSEFAGQAHVDDWSDYGSFSIFIDLPSVKATSSTKSKGYLYSNNYLPCQDGKVWWDFSMRKLTNTIRQAVKTYNGILEMLDTPKRVYDSPRWSSRNNLFMGYEKPYIKLSVLMP